MIIYKRKARGRMYFDGNSKICPICGGKIIHPYTGLVTSEQLEEEKQQVKEILE